MEDNFKKLIKLKDQDKLMNMDEVYIQFEKYLFKSVQSWQGKYEFDDLFSIASRGLIKAYNSYDANKGILFMTFLATIISNELKMFDRKEKKHLNNISLHSLIVNQNSNGESLEILDMVSDEIDYENESIDKITFSEIKQIINSLDEKYKQIILEFFFEGKNQNQLAEKLGLSQSYVSRLLRKITQIIRKKYERGICH